MSKLNFNTVPEAIGTEKSRYLWDASQNHLFPAILALLRIRQIRYLAIIGDKGQCHQWRSTRALCSIIRQALGNPKGSEP